MGVLSLTTQEVNFDTQLFNEPCNIESESFNPEILDEAPEKIYVNDCDAPYYTNSCLPSSEYQGDFMLLTNVGDVLCRYCSGGVVVHYYTPDIPDENAFYSFFKSVLKSRIPYFTLSRVIAYCKKCKKSFEDGNIDKCPECGNELDYISRVVGYARPVSAWNIGKKAEWSKRTFIKFNY